jgi:hypothetical protein
MHSNRSLVGYGEVRETPPQDWAAERTATPSEAVVTPWDGKDPSMGLTTERWRVELERVLEVSRRLLDLEPNFDGEGSSAYMPETWARAVFFLRQLKDAGILIGVRYLPSPSVDPGPHGTIDLHWETDRFELLVNIPAEQDSPISFYGDDYGPARLKGSFESSEARERILAWMLER